MEWLGNLSNFKGPAYCFGFAVEPYHHVTLSMHTLQNKQMYRYLETILKQLLVLQLLADIRVGEWEYAIVGVFVVPVHIVFFNRAAVHVFSW